MNVAFEEAHETPKTKKVDFVLSRRRSGAAKTGFTGRRLRCAAMIAAAMIAAALSSGCHKRAKPRVARAPAPATIEPRIGAMETGVASWYGYPYHGRRAANGEIYDMEKLTAAHRTLPFDTWVEVRNLANDKIVRVRITDRGPFVDGRIIDLSKAAARTIDLLGPGIGPVQITIIERPPPDEAPVVLEALEIFSRVAEPVALSVGNSPP